MTSLTSGALFWLFVLVCAGFFCRWFYYEMSSWFDDVNDDENGD